MKSFWEGINQFRKKREKREDNIEETRWDDQFSKLISREEEYAIGEEGVDEIALEDKLESPCWNMRWNLRDWLKRVDREEKRMRK